MRTKINPLPTKGNNALLPNTKPSAFDYLNYRFNNLRLHFITYNRQFIYTATLIVNHSSLQHPKRLCFCFLRVNPLEQRNCFCRKDVSLPHQLQRAMAAEAEASREARAKVIAAEGEMKASRALKEASDVINESPAALQVCS